MIIEGYKFGDFRIDIILRRLIRHEEIIPLSSKTFDILKLLVQRHGQIVAKEELISRVWPKQFVEENNLTVRMSALRKALGESPENRLIETVSGQGYRFVARVQAELRGDSESQGGGFRSLAILPFINQGNQQKLKYICEGIVEGLINSLSQLPQIKVMSYSTASRYEGRDNDPQAIGEELKVEAVLVGRISVDGGNLHISAELINASDGSNVWGARFSLGYSELSEIQDQIAGDLSANLRLKLTGRQKSQLVKRYTDDAEAYHLYLKGRYYYNNKRSVQGIQKAITYFKRAIKKDPNYAVAYTGLTDCYITISSYGLIPPKRIMPRAKAAVLKALKIDGSLGEAHSSLANILTDFEWDWRGAQKEYERAIELNPNHAHGHHVYANYLAKIGRMDQAIDELKKAKELDPLSLHINVGLGKLYYMARRYNDSITLCFETLDIEPGFAPANGVLGLIYLQQGLYEEATEGFKKVVAFSAGDYATSTKDSKATQAQIVFSECDPEVLAFLGLVYALDGNTSEARGLVNGLINMSKVRYVEPHTIALIYMGLGDKDSAFEWLEKAFKVRSMTLTYIKVWPLLDPLRSDPRYSDLVIRMGL